jgi:hypothetical protein
VRGLCSSRKLTLTVAESSLSIPQIALAAAQQLEAGRPTEIGFAPDVDIVILELHEGKECSKFFRGEFHSNLEIKRGDPIILQYFHYSSESFYLWL